jgi:predicted O-methyltransferase YrrM
MTDKRLFEIWASHGYYVVPNHFYEPIPPAADVDRAIGTLSSLVGVELNDEGQMELLRSLMAWKHEYDALPRHPDDSDDGFYLRNQYFGAVDAEVLYGLIRFLSPSRIIEIGSGFSTLVAARACRANRLESGQNCDLIALEPYPSEALRRNPDVTQLIERRVQDVSLDMFTELGRNDMLFIDSSHTVVTGGDVVRELLDIVPRLAEGVYVHVHDIFLPAEYPKKWLKDDHYFWTEQYLLQAFLAFNRSYQVVWAGHYMHLSQPAALSEAIASYLPDMSSPGSFWFTRVS